jgi:hypothetical protein
MEEAPDTINDVDRDSLHILPLSILPLETTILKSARMIKSSKLESVVEMFAGDEMGSGQVNIDDLPNLLNWDEAETNPDMIMLKKLAALPSYDVFSLRMSLRKLGINVKDHEALCLSENRNKELAKYMSSFTRPLILEIYGGDKDVKIESFEDVLMLFRSPDVKQALEKLRKMASSLGLEPEQVPQFLEDYGDIFLSLSYYRQCLDSIESVITSFLESIRDLKEAFQFREDIGFQNTVTEIESVINEAMAGLTGRFEAFDRASQAMWTEVSAEKFRKVEKLIKGFHTTNGGVLCLLSVKMEIWANNFPDKDTGGPVKRSEIIQSEIKYGMDKIRHLERRAPKLSEIN